MNKELLDEYIGFTLPKKGELKTEGMWGSDPPTLKQAIENLIKEFKKMLDEREKNKLY